VGVEEDEGDPMTTVGAGGGWSDSSPARIDDVVLDMGVATGGIVEGSRVMTPGGWPRLRDIEGAGREDQDATPPPLAVEGGAEAATA
jgi:hypothetical protein